MSRKRGRSDAELHARCDEVLHYLWDPIGVRAEPGARDEYEAYLPRVVARVMEGEAPRRIADYLLRLERDSMGLPGDRERAERVAAVLIGWREWLGDEGRGDRLPAGRASR